MPAVARTHRVTVITNGNYFSNLALRRLFWATNDTVEYQVILATGLRKPGSNRVAETWRLFRRWGRHYTAYKISTYAAPLIGRLLFRTPLFVVDTCRDLGIATFTVRDVNEPDARARIEAFAPDVLLSFSCPYRIGNPLLALPRIGCLNVHSSLLPRYAGVCTYVHVLADGEEVTGITVHEMVEKFDAGVIVAQEPVAIAPGTSVFELFATQCEVAGKLLQRCVPRILERGVVEGTAQDATTRTYRGEPKGREIDRLLHRGFHLARPKDLLALARGRRPIAEEANR